MIESSFLCPSAWDSDIFQDFSNCVPDIPSLFDINQFPETGSGDLSPYSNDFSSSSDDLILNNELNEFNLEVTEEFVSEILHESNAGFSDLDWLSFKDNTTKSPTKSPSKSNHRTNKSKSKKPSDHLQSSKKWSNMSETEQLETLHALSEIVTFHMCIREQMEIIKIIDPEAVISPDDKEFALDSTYLDDFKLERIKDLLKGQIECKKPSKSTNNFSSIKSSKKVNNSSKLLSRKSDSLPYSRTKRKQKKQDILLQPTEDKQLKLKRQKQTRKEQKSGFFVYEKKMKIENPQEDDEDVNILE